ncbi:MAG TPA: sigma-70 family RNA polymerase sigma factor [Flavipsychrobacter sp.]|nr:sigma-70 family RNA polymerase sigma factor [Flavipsychrobacter sp.]
MPDSQLKYTEEQLVTLLRQKSNEAFNYLYDNYSGVIFGHICHIITDQDTAQDVMQETFVKIWNNIAQYDNTRGRIYTWMINIARNTAVDKLRSKGEIMKTKIRGNEEIVNINAGKSEISTDTIGLKKMVSELKSDQKEIVDLAYFKGYTLDEISKALDTPLGTIKTRMRQAIKTLRQRFTA